MTESDLKLIKHRLSKADLAGATWDGLTVDEEDGYIHVHECSYLGATLVCLNDTYENHGNDCMFLQHAHGDVTALLAEVERLRTELAVLRPLKPIAEAAIAYYHVDFLALKANELDPGHMVRAAVAAYLAAQEGGKN